MERSLINAANFGPYELEVQRTVVDLGFALWNELTPEGKKVVDESVIRGMRIKPLEFLQVAQRRGRLELACRHFERYARPVDSKKVSICQGMEATP